VPEYAGSQFSDGPLGPAGKGAGRKAVGDRPAHENMHGPRLQMRRALRSWRPEDNPIVTALIPT